MDRDPREPTSQWPDDGEYLGPDIEFQEYERAFVRYRHRMDELGFPLQDVRMEPVLHTYEWTLAPGAETDSRAQNCYAEHLANEDLRWQSQRQRALAPLWERRRRHILDCLAARGVDVDDRLAYPAVVEAACTEGYSDCVVTAPWE